MTLQPKRQAGLPFFLQAAVFDLASRQYPELASKEEIPLLIALPAGIHPYNKTRAYYINKQNYIVMYQHAGRPSLDNRVSLSIIAHELAHWYQFRELGEKEGGSTNVHRKNSWMEACFVGTQNLWPKLGLERWQFTPTKSVRGKDGKVRKIQREGALTLAQLHAWPHSLSDFKEELLPMSDGADADQ